MNGHGRNLWREHGHNHSWAWWTAADSGRFKMLWDDNFLYFCAVTDEILMEDSEGERA
jgi:hypothetical protein